MCRCLCKSFTKISHLYNHSREKADEDDVDYDCKPPSVLRSSSRFTSFWRLLGFERQKVQLKLNQSARSHVVRSRPCLQIPALIRFWIRVWSVFNCQWEPLGRPTRRLRQRVDFFFISVCPSCCIWTLPSVNSANEKTINCIRSILLDKNIKLFMKHFSEQHL